MVQSLVLFYLELRLVCTKVHHFVEYTPVKYFNSFVQSAVMTSSQGDDELNSRVVAETMKLLANSSYGYHIMDRSHHSVTRYMNDEKTHAAINNKKFKILVHINDELYEVELAKSEIKQSEPIIVGFFVPQYSKLRLLELYYSFLLQNFATLTTMRYKWITIHSIWLKQKKNCMPEYEVTKNERGIYYAAKTVMIRSLQTLAAISSPRCVVLSTKKTWYESLDCSRKILDALKCACVARPTAVMTL